jgi:NADH-quinone oxidoreductase subunit G
MVGPDLYTHPNAANCARLVALIEKYTAFGITMIPNLVNTLGVALICDLDECAGSSTIGYNTAGDFTLSALGNGDLDMPALNQQEGTMTSIDKRVNPTNVAVGFGGYTLNDIANALGLNEALTINYTAQLPLSTGFSQVPFDSLPNYYTNAGVEVRGYLLESQQVAVGDDENVQAFDEKGGLTGQTLYLANPVLQFTPFTAKSHQLHEEGGLYGSSAFMSTHSLNAGDKVRITTSKGDMVVSVINDTKIDGEIAYLPTFDSKINSSALFGDYRFNNATIEKV